MFEQFKKLFTTSESLLDSAYNTTLTMLEYDYEMYRASKGVLRDTDGCDLPFDVKKMDRKINKYEREVRRNVLTHLTISGPQNLVPGLALVSIVIDVERIGDYTKNIVDLARQHEKRLHGGEFEETVVSLEKQIDEIFPIASEVLTTNDRERAQNVLKIENTFGKTAETIINNMINGQKTGLTNGEAVALALYVRYLKRINAHLTNIASAVTNPFPRISFRDKSLEEDDDSEE